MAVPVHGCGASFSGLLHDLLGLHKDALHSQRCWLRPAGRMVGGSWNGAVLSSCRLVQCRPFGVSPSPSLQFGCERCSAASAASYPWSLHGCGARGSRRPGARACSSNSALVPRRHSLGANLRCDVAGRRKSQVRAGTRCSPLLLFGGCSLFARTGS